MVTLVAVALNVVSAMSALPVVGGGGGGAAATVMLSACVSLKPLLSVTFTLKLVVPEIEGVPLMRPAALSDKPVGKLPLLTDQLYGAVPLLTVKVAL